MIRKSKKQRRIRPSKPINWRLLGIRSRVFCALALVLVIPWVMFNTIPAFSTAINDYVENGTPLIFLLIAALGFLSRWAFACEWSLFPRWKMGGFLTFICWASWIYYVFKVVPSDEFATTHIPQTDFSKAPEWVGILLSPLYLFVLFLVKVLVLFSPWLLGCLMWPDLATGKRGRSSRLIFGPFENAVGNTLSLMGLPIAGITLSVTGDPEHALTTFLALFAPFLILTGPSYFIIVKEVIWEHPLWRKHGKGRGGDARLVSVAGYTTFDGADVIERVVKERPRTYRDFEAERQKMARELATWYVGRTFPTLDPRIGCRDITTDNDAHKLIISAAGGGKSVKVGWNVIPMWPGGAFILDTKGEHAEQTLLERARRYGRCHLLDFWHHTNIAFPRGHYNPLAEVDINGPEARENLNKIISACLPEEKQENSTARHFRLNTQTVLMGYIVQLMTKFPSQYHTLARAYDLILCGHPDGGAASPKAAEQLLTDMAQNPAVGKAPMSAAKLLMDAGKNESGGFKTTLLKALEWVSSERFRKYMSKSSFKLSDVQDLRQTVYFVIRLDDIRDYPAFFKILINQGLVACRHDAPHNKRTLFYLDEFAQLDTFKEVKEGLVTMRSRGITFAMAIQDLGQLRERYENVDEFMGMCDVMAFGVNDQYTAEVLSKRLGEYKEGWKEGSDGSPRYVDKMRPLRSPQEVMEDLRKGSGMLYFIPTNGFPMRLELTDFTRFFKDNTGFKDKPKS